MFSSIWKKLVNCSIARNIFPHINLETKLGSTYGNEFLFIIKYREIVRK